MSQFDFGTVNPDIKSGTQLASDLNSWRDALNSMHRGNTRPTYAVQGMMWIDDTSTPWLIKMYNGDTIGTDTVMGSYNNTTGVGALVPDGDKGDITVSASGATWTVDNNVITPAKMSRTGTAGQVLTSGGAGADPSYQTPATNVFASSSENAAGTVENKAVDPLGIREAFNATGAAPIYACRAWVNFNGTGTVAIRASGNVSSITDNGTGDYTVNFSTAMIDSNYCVNLAVVGAAANNVSRNIVIYGSEAGGATLKSTAQLRINVGGTTAAGALDVAEMNVAIFR